MGRVIVKKQVAVNGAFEALLPADWLEFDLDSGVVSLQQMSFAEATRLAPRCRGPQRPPSPNGGRSLPACTVAASRSLSPVRS